MKRMIAPGTRAPRHDAAAAAGAATQPALVPLARTMAIRTGAAMVVVTTLLLVAFHAISSSREEQSAARYAGAKAEAIAQELDVFDQTMRIAAENAYGIFRRQFADTLELADESAGILVSDTTPINDVTDEVDDFARNFPGGNATVFVVQGEDYRRITTSVKREDGERAVGTLLDRNSPAYPRMRAGTRYVGPTVLFGRPFMTVYEPIRDTAGRIVAVLYIGLDLSAQQAALAAAVNGTRIFDTGGLYVINPGADASTASLPFHPSAAGRPLADVLPGGAAGWLERLKGAESGWLDDAPAVLRPDATGARFASVARSESTGWLVVAEVPAAEVFAAMYRQLAWIGGLIALTALLLGTALVTYLRRSVAPLAELGRQVRAIGRGDLSGRMASDRRDEIGAITRDLEAMRVDLARVVATVRSGTDAIATASNQIAAGNVDLSSRTEEQASSLEETASSMEELTSTVRRNADNARQANQLAASASEVAVRGGTVVGDVVATMGSIGESSRRIVDIISVIDGIAFQTNILALNAAVEAARAGEQGRGFAVVATEVRSLAQRSAAAAKEIKALIGDSVEKVDAGGKLVEAAGRTMDDVVASVKRVTDIMGEIAAASAEQSAGIEQVNQAIAQMDQVTQQNAALVEESAAASESMKDQAARLAEAVSIFRLSDGSLPPRAATTGRAASPAVATEVTTPTAATPRAATPASAAQQPAMTAPSPAPRARKRVAVGGGDDEWTEF